MEFKLGLKKTYM